MCLKMEKLDELTQCVKDAAKSTLDASENLCRVITRSNGQIKHALKKEAGNDTPPHAI